MIMIKDFEKEDSTVDWDKYHEAQKAAGEKCVKCGRGIYIMFSDAVPYSECGECKSVAAPEELSHSSQVRCPKCGETEDAFENHNLYEEDDHEICCPYCGCEYTVSTSVIYTFTSPAMLEVE